MKLTGKLSKFTLLLFLLWLPVSVWGPESVEALTASSPGSSGNGVGNIPQGTQSETLTLPATSSIRSVMSLPQPRK